jgi:TRAP-type C4-dicarboxylate transport system permease small subunit
MQRLKTIIDRVLGGFLALAMALAVAAVLWQVFSRYVLADPSSFTDELVRYLMVWIGLLGAAYAAGGHRALRGLRRGGHQHHPRAAAALPFYFAMVAALSP